MDLIVIIVISIVIMPLAALTSGVARAVFGVIFVFFVPGYAMISALFPKRESLRTIDRIVLSIGISLAIVTFSGVILNFTPLGVHLWPVLIVLACFIIIISGIAWFRRRQLPANERFSLSSLVQSIKLIMLTQNGDSRLRNFIYIAIVFIVLGTLGTMYAMSRFSYEQKNNGYYILSPEGTSIDYPRTIHPGEPVVLQAVIENNQSLPLTYEIKVVVNEQELASYSDIQVAPNKKWQRELSFVPGITGTNQKVEYILINKENAEVEERLYIWIDIVK